MTLQEPEAVAFGPYAFALTSEEAEAAAARYGLRAALAGGLTLRHHAPLAAFILVILFASILSLTGLMSRRAGEIAILLAAMAYMIQRLTTHWRFQAARRKAREALLKGQGTQTVVVESQGVSFETDGVRRLLPFASVEEAENAGGLLYLWPRAGAPVVVPTRALPGAEAEGAQLVAQAKRWLRSARG